MIIGPTLLINETNKNGTGNHLWPQRRKKTIDFEAANLKQKSLDNTILQVIVKTF